MLVDPANLTPVVSVVMRREDQSSRILLGVRALLANSPRHPHVLSTPTMRVPLVVIEAALATLGTRPPHPAVGEILAIDAGGESRIGVPKALSDPVAFLTEGLLVRKLGLADAVLNGEFTGSAQISGLALDVVSDPDSGLPDELTYMLTVTVDVHTGADLVPTATAAYSGLHWVPADEVSEAVRKHDALLLLPNADPFAVCLYGLCVRSASHVLLSATPAGPET